MNTTPIFDLSGDVAVITGASSGIGVQMAKALARQGAEIALLARRKEKLEQIAEDIKTLGVRCIPIKCDVTKSSDIVLAAQEVRSIFNKADILVNNAGTGGVGPAEEMTDEIWEQTLSVDLDGVFKMAREFSKMMITNKYGRIINIASIYGLVGNLAMPTSAYHSAKGGVINLTRALAAEWAKHNITVNAICPGFFESEMTQDVIHTESFASYMRSSVPMGRYGMEGELDTAVVFLASRGSTYVNGAILPVDGGYTCI